MKKNQFLIALAGFAALVTACNKPVTEKQGDAVAISELKITSGESVRVPGNITFDIEVTGTKDLSTLEVSAALEDGTILASSSIRTPGKSASLKNQALPIPFGANMKNGASIGVTFEAINVEGNSVKQSKVVTIERPNLPATLYMTIGSTVHEMTQDPDNASRYTTSKGSFESILSAHISSSATLAESEFIWGGTDKANVAAIGNLSSPAISVSFPEVLVESFSFDTETFAVTANGEVLDISIAGVKLVPESGLLHASVSFTKNAEVTVTGLTDLEKAYNRDFFSYKDGKLTFLRESGTYDVYFSPKYNYIWVAQMDAVAPDCLWIMGHGFTCASQWHEDYKTGGWQKDEIVRLGFAPKIGENLYQCTMYLNNAHEWGSFEFEIYSARDLSKVNGFGGKSITGDTKGVALNSAKDGKPGLTSGEGFQDGYYVVTFNNATGEINLNRLSEWKDLGESGLAINGTVLEVDPAFNYATLTLTKGQEVKFSGFTEIAKEYNRDFFDYKDGKFTFAAVSGEYTVRYYPAYKYMWLFNADMAFPDCIYILGSGKMASPVYYEDIMWEDVGYVRSAPFFVVAPKVAENTYRATMSMSTSNKDWRVLLELYSDLSWGQTGVLPNGTVTGGAAPRFTINTEKGWIQGIDEKEDPFQPGNYRFVITTSSSGAALDITKLD